MALKFLRWIDWTGAGKWLLLDVRKGRILESSDYSWPKLFSRLRVCESEIAGVCFKSKVIKIAEFSK